ncbi:MAG: glutathionylspermidine synthase family protein [Actinomycetota bacterium]|nr:glutathionylspermidine synthase family protein [Actinomycetota bacterium]
MYRHASRPRPDWRRTVEGQGLVYPYTPLPGGGQALYWNESAFYELSSDEVDALEATTEELHRMCVQAAQHLASGELGNLGLTPGALELVRHSLTEDQPSLYGRFDLRFDGLEPAKLLEYNADTPTGLVESAVAQWHWLEDVMPSTDQWNSLHERLVQQWRTLARRLPGGALHLAHSAAEPTGEEWMTVAYVRDTADQAGIPTVGLTIEDLGWDHTLGLFVDLDDRPIGACFKLYPWESMLAEPFGRHLLDNPDRPVWIEPAWKAVLSNKALLAALWQLYPGHENLLPAYVDDPGTLTEWVAKPLHGREGDGIRVQAADADTIRTTSTGTYGREGYCYQQWAPLPSYDGNHPVLGCWMVGGNAAGLGIRESDGYITDGYARFVPHVISAPRPDAEQAQRWLRE